MKRLVHKLRGVPRTGEVVQALLTSVLAVGVLAVAMILRGSHGVGFLIAAAIGLITLRIVFQVYFAIQHFREHSDLLKQMGREAEEHYVTVLKRIVRFTELREAADGGRSERIARLCEQISGLLGMPPEKCQRMALAGWLHDIGLLAVPEQILHKATRLSGDEFRSIKRHAQASYEVLQPLEMLQDVLPAIRHHHERLNGTGYPDGLQGDAIPIEARILAVADAYDALTHDRPHRPAMAALDAVRELQRCSPDGFDPACVEAVSRIANVPAIEAAMASVRPMKPTSADALAEA